MDKQPPVAPPLTTDPDPGDALLPLVKLSKSSVPRPCSVLMERLHPTRSPPRFPQATLSTNDFCDIDADKLTLWRVPAVPITEDDEDVPSSTSSSSTCPCLSPDSWLTLRRISSKYTTRWNPFEAYHKHGVAHLVRTLVQVFVLGSSDPSTLGPENRNLASGSILNVVMENNRPSSPSSMPLSPRPPLPYLARVRDIGQHQPTLLTCDTGLSINALFWIQSSGSGLKDRSTNFEEMVIESNGPGS
ncbi:MAG: hypothetical protein J3R72DRAFT_492820 [Linnemannia gamsii]|nr:MAG: hypothetical protein J3R72DRAFT_492820 [Linnemannia gamsii]